MKKFNKSFLIDVAVFVIATSFILWIAWLNYKLFEIIVFISIYHFIKDCFIKAFHADSITTTARMAVIICYIITYVVQLVFVFLLVKFSISYFFNIIIAICLGYVSYRLQDYLDLLEKSKQVNIYTLKEPELRAYCHELGLNEQCVEVVVARLIYGFKGESLYKHLGYSAPQVKRFDKKIKQKILF